MSAKFEHDGVAIDYTPDTDISAGDIVVLNDLVCVAKRDIDSGDLGALHTEGVYLLDEDEIENDATDYSKGEAVYLDDVTHDNEFFGHAVEDGGDTESGKIRVKLIQTLGDTYGG